ncbi:MAG TPA: hypothetical protein VNC78_11735 [Actinomycetota bacterium]|nr:hypothetical protein [Actinomycetota bacterium]
MDSVFVQGIAGFIAALIVFCGSIWLLLALVLGARLAYFVSASVTLAFILLMGVVWSVGTPLGPVGVLPSWGNVGIAPTADQIDFSAASQYPDGGGWHEPDAEDTLQITQAGELEGDATEVLEKAIEDEKIDEFTSTSQAKANRELARLIEVNGVTYGAVTFEPVPLAEGVQPSEDDPDPDARVVVVMEYDPGNPLGKARLITAGTFVVFVAHLLGLSLIERRAKKRDDGKAA